MTSSAWLLYTRVSTEDQAGGHSLDAQLAACRAYATMRGWQVAAEISDEVSGATLKRPGMQRVLADLKAGRAAGVIAWRLDRLTRSVRDLVSLIDLCETAKVGLVSVTENLDTTTPMGRFVVFLLGAMAQWERETISVRTKAGMAQARRTGHWAGGTVPAGCALVVEGERRRLVPGPDAERVRQVWPWIMAGHSLREVAERLTAEGVPAARRGGDTRRRTGWTSSSVYRLLTSPQVAGVLVDASVQALARATLAGRGCPMRHRGTPLPRAAEPSALAGLVRCPSCGGAMHQATATGNGGRYRYLRCSARGKRRSLCAQRDLRVEPLEKAVLAALPRALEPDGVYRREIHAQYEIARQRAQEARDERLRLTSRRDQLKARIGDLACRDGRVGSDAWALALSAAGEELARVDHRLAELEGVISAGEVDVASLDVVLDELRKGAERIGELPVLEQARALRAVISAVQIHPDRVVLDLYRPALAGRKAGEGFSFSAKEGP